MGKGIWVYIQPQAARQCIQGRKLLGMVYTGSLSWSFLSLSAPHMLPKPPACHSCIWDLVPTSGLVPLCGTSFAHSDPRQDRGHLFAALCLLSERSCTIRSLFSSHPLLRFAGEPRTEAWPQVGCLWQMSGSNVLQFPHLQIGYNNSLTVVGG